MDYRKWQEQKKSSSAVSVGTHRGRRWNGFPRRQVGRKPSTVGQSQAGEEMGQEEQLVASKSPEPLAAWGAGSRVSGPRTLPLPRLPCGAVTSSYQAAPTSPPRWISEPPSGTLNFSPAS